MEFEFQRNNKVCRLYQLTGKCNKSKCKKKHPKEIYIQHYLSNLFIPEELLYIIYEYTDLNTKYNISMINKKYNEKYFTQRINIIKHYDIVDDTLKQLADKLNSSITTNNNRIESCYDMEDRYGLWKSGTWQVYDQIECSYCGIHCLEMTFILNPRDCNLQSWKIDNNTSIFCF